MSLLDVALQQKTKQRVSIPTEDQLNLALAFIDGRVGLKGVTAAIECSTATAVYLFVARTLRDAHRHGMVAFTVTRPHP